MKEEKKPEVKTDPKLEILLKDLDAEFASLHKRIKLRTDSTIFTFYKMLRREYVINRYEYNKTSIHLTKKQRQAKYLALVYKQGCLKSFEYMLSLDEEAPDGPSHPQA